jgi:ATP phosphoribosyltransferase
MSAFQADSQLILALSKGRIFEDTLPLLEAAGITVTEESGNFAQADPADQRPERARDHRARHRRADLCAAWRGRLRRGRQGRAAGARRRRPVPADRPEHRRCRMSVAVRNGFDYETAVRQGARLRVATKYVETAREHFAKKGVHVDLIKLYGSMELAPLVGLSDAIVDVVSTGSTLRANDLVEVEAIMDISSRLIVNQAALKLKRERLQPIIEAFERASKKMITKLDSSQADFKQRLDTLLAFEASTDDAIEPPSPDPGRREGARRRRRARIHQPFRPPERRRHQHGGAGHRRRTAGRTGRDS